ncbi:MAG: RNA methyltransferase [Acidobacteria bacterium]|nr:RNA methyltransferase [Acidobacteriota bacterium]
MLIYGFHPVREALRHRPHEVDRVLMAERRAGRRAEEIERLCSRQRVPLERVRASELSRRVEGVHNGFAAHLSVADSPASAGDPELVVLVEDIQDPRNLGALLRVCEATGVGRVLIRDRGSAPVTAAVVKASAGAAEWLTTDRIPNTAAAIERYRDQGYWIYGADSGGEPCWDVDLTGKILLCMGGEESGLRARTRKICDRLVALPMQGKVQSLNVATATAGLLFEALRQRRTPQ